MMTEDLHVFFNAAEFATSITLNGVVVAAIFDAPGSVGSVGAFGMASTQPELTLASADVPANPVGLPAIVNGTSYLVASHEPKGTGVSVLALELA